ncbi:MAG: nucleoside triphosphate pyrophosphohydrolase [bacterium]|nr:nucleoside triphosphate pyrophosphohydrolase [bacterium]
MKTVTYNKLVRDGIPKYLKGIGVDCETKTVPLDARLPHLLSKLVEEARETARAKPAKLTHELADVLEVLEAITRLQRISWEDITAEQKRIRDERGGFEKGIFLISTTEPDKPTK